MNKCFLTVLKFLIVCLIFFLNLSGCIRFNNSLENINPSALDHSDNWTLRGKIGIHAPKENVSALIYWQQKGKNYYIRLFGPLGLGTIELNGTPNQTTLTDHQGKIYQAASPELLLKQTLGFQMPVLELQYWIRGMPAPNSAAKKIYKNNPSNLIKSIVQQGWKIHYLRYHQNRPELIALNYRLPNNQIMSLTIVIYEFSG